MVSDSFGGRLGAEARHISVQDGLEPVAAAIVGATVQQGSTAHYQVEYDDGLAANGVTLATAVLAACEADYTRLRWWFGDVDPVALPFVVDIVPGRGGAGHASCAATTMFCDAFDGTDNELVNMLTVAEADEVFMATVGNWNCGYSTGEGLSRMLANACHPDVGSATAQLFLTAGYWLDNGRPDYVTQSEQTDRDYLSIGCSTLFLSWLRFALHYGWCQIIAAGGSTLTATYTNLTGQADALTPFTAAVNRRYPVGTPSGLSTSDNPFPLELQLCGATNTGALLHTIRHPDGTWQPFGDVKGQAGDPGHVQAVGSAGVDGDMQLVVETDQGAMFHTIRYVDGTWQPFGDVKGQAGDPGHFIAVAASCVNGEIHVVGETDSGSMVHTIRHANGSWQTFGDVKGQAGDPGHFSAVGAAGVDGELHVAGETDTGSLFHTIRHADGTWQGYGDVKGQAGDPGLCVAVACAEVAGGLHLVVETSTGGMFHTIRHADGSWQGFGDVKGQAGDPGYLRAVGCASVAGELQVAAEGADGGMWHTIRHPDGSWDKFGDVQGQAGGGNNFTAATGVGV